MVCRPKKGMRNKCLQKGWFTLYDVKGSFFVMLLSRKENPGGGSTPKEPIQFPCLEYEIISILEEATT